MPPKRKKLNDGEPVPSSSQDDGQVPELRTRRPRMQPEKTLRTRLQLVTESGVPQRLYVPRPPRRPRFDRFPCPVIINGPMLDSYISLGPPALHELRERHKIPEPENCPLIADMNKFVAQRDLPEEVGDFECRLTRMSNPRLGPEQVGQPGPSGTSGGPEPSEQGISSVNRTVESQRRSPSSSQQHPVDRPGTSRQGITHSLPVILNSEQQPDFTGSCRQPLSVNGTSRQGTGPSKKEVPSPSAVTSMDFSADTNQLLPPIVPVNRPGPSRQTLPPSAIQNGNKHQGYLEPSNQRPGPASQTGIDSAAKFQSGNHHRDYVIHPNRRRDSAGQPGSSRQNPLPAATVVQSQQSVQRVEVPSSVKNPRKVGHKPLLAEQVRKTLNGGAVICSRRRSPMPNLFKHMQTEADDRPEPVAKLPRHVQKNIKTEKEPERSVSSDVSSAEVVKPIVLKRVTENGAPPDLVPSRLAQDKVNLDRQQEAQEVAKEPEQAAETEEMMEVEESMGESDQIPSVMEKKVEQPQTSKRTDEEQETEQVVQKEVIMENLPTENAGILEEQVEKTVQTSLDDLFMAEVENPAQNDGPMEEDGGSEQPAQEVVTRMEESRDLAEEDHECYTVRGAEIEGEELDQNGSENGGNISDRECRTDPTRPSPVPINNVVSTKIEMEDHPSCSSTVVNDGSHLPSSCSSSSHNPATSVTGSEARTMTPTSTEEGDVKVSKMMVTSKQEESSSSVHVFERDRGEEEKPVIDLHLLTGSSELNHDDSFPDDENDEEDEENEDNSDDEDGPDLLTNRLVDLDYVVPQNPTEGYTLYSSAQGKTFEDNEKDTRKLKFDLGRVIGSGRFSCIFRGYCQKDGKADPREKAIKLIRRDSWKMDRYLLLVMEAKENRFVLLPSTGFRGRFPETEHTVFLTMPLMKMSLAKLWLELKVVIPHRLIVRLMAQVAQGIQFVHTFNRVYGRLQPSNILFRELKVEQNTDGKLEAVHFDSVIVGIEESSNISEAVQMKPFGTSGYRAPELVAKPTLNSLQEYKWTDSWSLGLLCAQLLWPTDYTNFSYEDKIPIEDESGRAKRLLHYNFAFAPCAVSLEMTLKGKRQTLMNVWKHYVSHKEFNTNGMTLQALFKKIGRKTAMNEYWTLLKTCIGDCLKNPPERVQMESISVVLMQYSQ